MWLLRSARAEEPVWGEEEDFADHDYYNSIPGKEPPIGGVVDSRLRMSGAMPGHIHTQPQSKSAAQVNVRHHYLMLFEMELKLHLVTVTKWRS